MIFKTEQIACSFLNLEFGLLFIFDVCLTTLPITLERKIYTITT